MRRRAAGEQLAGADAAGQGLSREHTQPRSEAHQVRGASGRRGCQSAGQKPSLNEENLRLAARGEPREQRALEDRAQGLRTRSQLLHEIDIAAPNRSS